MQPALRVGPAIRCPGRITLRVAGHLEQQVQPGLDLLKLGRLLDAPLDPHVHQLLLERSLGDHNPETPHSLMVAHKRRLESRHRVAVGHVVEAAHVHGQLRKGHGELLRLVARKAQGDKDILDAGRHLLELVLGALDGIGHLGQVGFHLARARPKDDVELAPRLLGCTGQGNRLFAQVKERLARLDRKAGRDKAGGHKGAFHLVQLARTFPGEGVNGHRRQPHLFQELAVLNGYNALVDRVVGSNRTGVAETDTRAKRPSDQFTRLRIPDSQAVITGVCFRAWPGILGIEVVGLIVGARTEILGIRRKLHREYAARLPNRRCDRPSVLGVE